MIEVLPVEQFLAAVAPENIVLLDVRTPEEYESGHLPNAILANFYDPDQAKSVIQKLEKTEHVYLYCRSGVRSLKFAEALQEMGFLSITDMQGGYLAYLEHKAHS